jgi:hypothetical protein
MNIGKMWNLLFNIFQKQVSYKHLFGIKLGKFITKYPVGLFLCFLTQRPNITYVSGQK